METGRGQNWAVYQAQDDKMAAGEKAAAEVWLSLYLAKDTLKVHRGSVRRGWPDCELRSLQMHGGDKIVFKKKYSVNNTVVT